MGAWLWSTALLAEFRYCCSGAACTLIAGLKNLQRRLFVLLQAVWHDGGIFATEEEGMIFLFIGTLLNSMMLQLVYHCDLTQICNFNLLIAKRLLTLHVSVIQAAAAAWKLHQKLDCLPLGLMAPCPPLEPVDSLSSFDYLNCKGCITISSLLVWSSVHVEMLSKNAVFSACMVASVCMPFERTFCNTAEVAREEIDFREKYASNRVPRGCGR